MRLIPPGPATPGMLLDVDGAGFKPNTFVRVGIVGPGYRAGFTHQFRTDPSGTFSVGKSAPMIPGTYRVRVERMKGKRWVVAAESPFRVESMEDPA